MNSAVAVSARDTDGSREYDLIIIGGGIYGAMLALVDRLAPLACGLFDWDSTQRQRQLARVTATVAPDVRLEA